MPASPVASLGRLRLRTMAAQRRQAFRGRTSEREALDRLLENVRSGQSAVLVIRGEAGVGKTALLRYAARQASGFRLAQIAGVESEMELPFAGLHQLCAPMLDQLEALPEPQHRALSVALGLSSGDAPDRFLVGLAVLSLLSEVAVERPLLCLVDDAQWLDGASRQVLGFVARRLLAESVAIVFAVRESSDDRELVGLPELPLGGLEEEDARALLATVIPGRLDERVRDRIVAETRGNPLALLELPRGLSAAQLAGGFGLPDVLPLSGRIEESFLRRLESLPAGTRLLLLVAAADPVGDPALMWRAAGRLEVATERLEPGERAGLLEVGASRAVSSSAGALGGLPVGIRSGEAERAWRVGGRDRCDARTRIAAPGTVRRPHEALMRTSRRSSSSRRGGRRHVGASPLQPRSWGRRPADGRSGAPRGAHARGGAGERAGRRVRCGARAAGRRGGRTAG